MKYTISCCFGCVVHSSSICVFIAVCFVLFPRLFRLSTCVCVCLHWQVQGPLQECTRRALPGFPIAANHLCAFLLAWSCVTTKKQKTPRCGWFWMAPVRSRTQGFKLSRITVCSISGEPQEAAFSVSIRSFTAELKPSRLKG